MRFLGIVGLVTLGAAAGCADAASTIVDEHINWIAKCAGGGCSNFTFHDPMMVKYNYKVNCKRTGNSIDITITDPGTAGTADMLMADMHAPGEISIRNYNAMTNQCNITVRDAMQFGQATVPLIGTCAGSRASTDTSDCTVLGSFNKDGWDWIGTVQCTKIPNQNLITQVYSLEAAGGGPVQVAVDNCD